MGNFEFKDKYSNYLEIRLDSSLKMMGWQGSTIAVSASENISIIPTRNKNFSNKLYKISK